MILKMKSYFYQIFKLISPLLLQIFQIYMHITYIMVVAKNIVGKN